MWKKLREKHCYTHYYYYRSIVYIEKYVYKYYARGLPTEIPGLCENKALIKAGVR